MYKKHSRKIFLLSTVLSFIGLGAIILTAPPDSSYTFGFLSLSIFLLFFPLCFIFTFGLITLAFKRPIFGLIVGAVFLLLLFFRMAGLTHPFFLILIAGLFISALLFFKKDKNVEG